MTRQLRRPDLKNLNVSICDNAAYVFCSKCNERQQVAFGTCAESMPRVNILKALKMLKWQAAPVFLCVNCRVATENQS